MLPQGYTCQKFALFFWRGELIRAESNNINRFKIVYKKTDEWYIEWQRMTTSVQRMTTSDN